MTAARLAALAAATVLLAGLSMSIGPASAQAPDLGRRVYEKANCVGCHKWHGGGGGGYGGAALSLRETALERAELIEVIRCGRPATRMPYHDRSAYDGTACYGGMTKADLGADFPPKAATFLREQEIEAVTAYVIEHLQGQGEPTYEDCVAFWGEGNRECEAMR
ncbi:MAG TPA: c-type cytochrome [Geminicoccaceae bacterium]